MVASVENTTYTPADFITGDFPVVTEPETIALSAALAQYSVLGRVTATDKLILSDAGAVDGSETPVAILVEAVDASAADAVGPVYKAGQFNPDKLVFGPGHDADTVAAAFEGTPLFLRAPL